MFGSSMIQEITWAGSGSKLQEITWAGSGSKLQELTSAVYAALLVDKTLVAGGSNGVLATRREGV